MPAWLRSPVIAVLGVLLGSGFDEQSLLGLWRWLPSLGLMTVYTAVTTVFSIIYLRRVARLDAQTAYFCAAPGGLGIMVILGDRMGGDLLTITLVHAVRVLLVVFTIPLALGFFEGLHVPPIADAVQATSGYEIGLMVVSAILGSVLGVVLHLPAPTMLGPMLTTAAGHVPGAHARRPAAVRRRPHPDHRRRLCRLPVPRGRSGAPRHRHRAEYRADAGDAARGPACS